MSKGVLILGGSGFMGKLLVESLKHDGIEVFTVNRGKRHWGEKHVPSAKADRRGEVDEYKRAIDLLIANHPHVQWLGVVDFCAFKPSDVNEETLPKTLFDPTIFPIYVFISTDSVYEVVPGIENLGVEITEEITNKLSRHDLVKERDKYGYYKLMAERALSKRSPDTQSLVSLRLPDVIGEFDDTFRFWKYFYLILRGAFVYVDKEDSQVCAFVYAGDVVKVLRLLLDGSGTPIKETMNIGCEEQVLMKEFLEMFSEEVKKTEDRKYRSRSYLPSVEFRKTRLSFERMEQVLGFEPISLREAVQRTSQWFADKFQADPELFEDSEGSWSVFS